MRTVASLGCCGLALLTLAGLTLIGCAQRHDISEAELVRRTQQLYDAVAPGDRAPWQKFFSDDCMFFDEKGHNMNKKELVASITPLPNGYSGSIVVQNAKSHIDADIAILSYDLDETEIVYGQGTKARYHETDTWMQRKGEWKIVAGQVFRYYEDPVAGIMDEQELQYDPGSYELAPGKAATVSRGWEQVVLAERHWAQNRTHSRSRTGLFSQGSGGADSVPASGGRRSGCPDRPAEQ